VPRQPVLSDDAPQPSGGYSQRIGFDVEGDAAVGLGD
jgi:hypothetical protein